MSILKMNNVTKKFGKFTALDGVNLEINKGEIYGFIGPNGAGKTTTIRILLGVLQATSGNATILGKDVWNDAVSIHKDIAYVPGDVNLWDNLTGGEVIDLFIKLRGTSNKNRKEELIKKFDFDPSKKCRTYSKGNRQKVALVAALSSDAEVYILDEPTSGLDPLMEMTFQECLFDLKKQGKSIFLSSHILSEVEKLCDRVSIIREGKIIDTGTLKELRHLSRTHIEVDTKKEIKDLEKQKGVHDIQQNKDEIIFQVDNENLGNVISYLTQFEISSLRSTPPSLEELFMTHYKI
ncbi:MAG: ABC transporter ATP-binding protein [Oscillospiraceae bacterium]|nr:ABC transporter ATP-binding protein [Oscillospiraceae bacterium]